MDEACLNVGKTTDSMLLEAMDGKLKGNEHYTSRSIDSKENKNLVIGQDFVIRHYAGMYTRLISCSAHRTPNFMNPEYFVCLFFEYFFQTRVLNRYQIYCTSGI